MSDQQTYPNQVFHHVPKSGGTFVLASLRGAGNGSMNRIPNHNQAFGRAAMKPGFNSSHHAFTNLRPKDDEFYFTWLREPVDMVYSAWSYYRSIPGTKGNTARARNVALGIQVARIHEAESLEEYIDRALTDRFPLFPYGQFTLDFDRFHFVGFAESMDDSLVELAKRSDLQISPPEEKVNVSKPVERYREDEVAELLRVERAIYDREFAKWRAR